MKFRLNFWQTSLLFLPLIAGFIIVNLPQHSFSDSENMLRIFSFLAGLNIWMLFAYQAYLGNGFNNADARPSVVFKINLFVPVVFFGVYQLYITYLMLFKHTAQIAHSKPGPIAVTHIKGLNWLVVLFLVYGMVCFIFVNNQYVARRIKKIDNAARQEQLTKDYLVPMRHVVRLLGWMLGVCILLSIAADIYRLVSAPGR